MKSRPIFLRALKARSLPPSRLTLLPPISRPIPQIRHLSSTIPLRQAQADPKSAPGSESGPSPEKESEGKKAGGKKKAPTPEENSGPVRSPFAVFAEVLKEEISKNKAWQENVKTLQGDVDKMADSAAMQRARELYERARVSLTRRV